MNSRVLPFAAAVLVVLAPTPVTGAQPPAPVPQGVSEPALGQELAGIRAALDQIAGLLRRQLEEQRLELILRRVDLAEARLTPLEGALRGARDQRLGVDQERKQLEARLEQLARQVEEDDEAVRDMPEGDILRFTSELTLEIRLLGDRLRDLDLRIVEMENEIATDRDLVRRWIDLVDRRLAAE